MSLCSSACRLLVSCAAIAGVFASCYGSERAQLAGCQEMRLRPGAGGLARGGRACCHRSFPSLFCRPPGPPRQQARARRRPPPPGDSRV